MKKKNEKTESVYPKLTLAQLKEITELVIVYETLHRVLKYWQAVKLDDKGNIIAVCDFTDWYNQNDYNKAKYENFEPLKGIRYLGQGFYTFVPYQLCSEWISTWSVWITGEANRGDIQAQSLMVKAGIKRPQVV